MARKLSDDLQPGDPVRVALRGGAGWLSGTVVWIHESSVLLKHNDPALDEKTPYVLIDISEVTGLALPREIEPPSKSASQPGFLRD